MQLLKIKREQKIGKLKLCFLNVEKFRCNKKFNDGGGKSCRRQGCVQLLHLETGCLSHIFLMIRDLMPDDLRWS